LQDEHAKQLRDEHANELEDRERMTWRSRRRTSWTVSMRISCLIEQVKNQEDEEVNELAIEGEKRLGDGKENTEKYVSNKRKDWG